MPLHRLSHETPVGDTRKYQTIDLRHHQASQPEVHQLLDEACDADPTEDVQNHPPNLISNQDRAQHTLCRYKICEIKTNKSK